MFFPQMDGHVSHLHTIDRLRTRKIKLCILTWIFKITFIFFLIWNLVLFWKSLIFFLVPQCHETTTLVSQCHDTFGMSSTYSIHTSRLRDCLLKSCELRPNPIAPFLSAHAIALPIISRALIISLANCRCVALSNSSTEVSTNMQKIV